MKPVCFELKWLPQVVIQQWLNSLCLDVSTGLIEGPRPIVQFSCIGFICITRVSLGVAGTLVHLKVAVLHASEVFSLQLWLWWLGFRDCFSTSYFYMLADSREEASLVLSALKVILPCKYSQNLYLNLCQNGLLETRIWKTLKCAFLNSRMMQT